MERIIILWFVLLDGMVALAMQMVGEAAQLLGAMGVVTQTVGAVGRHHGVMEAAGQIVLGVVPPRGVAALVRGTAHGVAVALGTDNLLRRDFVSSHNIRPRNGP